MSRDEELSRQLSEENEEFRRIKEEHAWIHRKVEYLDSKPFLTPSEKVERDQLKKKKLLLKDRMESIVSSYRQRGEGTP